MSFRGTRLISVICQQESHGLVIPISNAENIKTRTPSSRAKLPVSVLPVGSLASEKLPVLEKTFFAMSSSFPVRAQPFAAKNGQIASEQEAKSTGVTSLHLTYSEVFSR